MTASAATQKAIRMFPVEEDADEHEDDRGQVRRGVRRDRSADRRGGGSPKYMVASPSTRIVASEAAKTVPPSPNAVVTEAAIGTLTTVPMRSGTRTGR